MGWWAMSKMFGQSIFNQRPPGHCRFLKSPKPCLEEMRSRPQTQKEKQFRWRISHISCGSHETSQKFLLFLARASFSHELPNVSRWQEEEASNSEETPNVLIVLGLLMFAFPNVYLWLQTFWLQLLFIGGVMMFMMKKWFLWWRWWW